MQQLFVKHLLFTTDSTGSEVQWGAKPDMILALVELTVY